LKESTRTLCR
jgi:hypothetical protein